MRTQLNFTLLTTSLVFTGCVVGPDYATPQTVTPATFSQVTGNASIQAKHWSGLYNDPALTQLVQQTRENNHSLGALYQRTLQSRAIIRRERAERRPQLNSQSSYQRSEESEEAGSGANQERYEAGIDFAWEFDVFGRVSRLIEAAVADAEAAEAAYQDLLLITETDTATTYFQIRALDREIVAVERSIGTRRESLEITQKRFDSGAVSDLDLAQAETLLAESEAERAVLLRQRDALEHALAVLIGRPATDFKVGTQALAGTPSLPPVGLPSELLQRRPDLRLAELNLKAANARVGVANANFFPRITIGADAGTAAMNVDDWFKGSAGFYSMGPQISLPIFQGGRLRAELSRSEAQYAESLERYQQAILEAFAQVEDALSGWQHLSVQRAARERAAKAAARAQDISNKQYRNGLVDFISALDSERVALDAERRLAQVIGDEYVNSVFLIRAIGGSWK
jgi:multidrug efflux system outer membrane protein